MANRRRTLGIRKRGEKWTARPYLNGERSWVGSFDTYEEAEAAVLAELAHAAPSSRETVEAYAARWLEQHPRPKDSTNETYAYGARAFAGDFGAAKLRSIHLSPYGRRVRAKTPRQAARAWALEHRTHLGAVRAMFADAVDDGLVAENPFTSLRLPASRGRRDLVVLRPEELEQLADTAGGLFGAYGPMVRAIILFAAYTGVRPSELFALERGDLDFERGELTIARQAYRRRVTAPKNGRTRRIILPPPAADAVRSIPAQASGLLFTNKRGGRLTQEALHRYWSVARAAIGRPELDFYDLRHYCATYLLERFRAAGMDGAAEVALQLGHTDDGHLVRTRYGHPDDDRARDRLRRIFEQNVTELRPATVAQRSQAG